MNSKNDILIVLQATVSIINQSLLPAALAKDVISAQALLEYMINAVTNDIAKEKEKDHGSKEETDRTGI